MTTVFSVWIRRVVIIAVLYVVNAPFAVHAEEDYSRKEITDKISSYRRLQAGGGVMLSGGIALDILGPIAFFHGMNRLDEENSLEGALSGFGWVLLGGIGMFGGGLTTTGGIVMMSVGKRKMEEYQRKLGTVSLRIRPGGLLVVFEF